MIKEIIREKFGNCPPAGYLHKLTVCRNELDDMIAEFQKEWNWCSGCQDYVHVNDSKTELMHDFSPARNVLKCKKCNHILKIID